VSDRLRWALGSLILATALTLVVWLVVTDAPIVRFVIRLYRDKPFLKETVVSWGSSAPLIFIAIQALQVIISPIPGEMTGPVGGALFGTTLGVVYSTIGLTAGTLICFGLGRLYGEPLVRPWLSEQSWKKMRFIVEAEGAILCFILYLIPGFPKDIVSYLFGISPIPFWVFGVASTLGRLPGTWISSYVGAHVAEHEFITLFLMLALVAAVSIPLYYYRHRIVDQVTGLGHRRSKHVDSGVSHD
jgi:uncharacterized membrane protein YdjX (TVP38/TMEM64 family)